jgi:hypothetical protein
MRIREIISTRVKHTCATILAILYLYSTVGATIYHHYCMGTLVSTSLLGSTGKNCEKCGMQKHATKKNKGCCKDVQACVKSADHHITPQLHYEIPVPSLFVIPHSQNLSQFYIPTSDLYTTVFVHSPPTPFSCPVFIRLQTLRI